MHDVNEVYEKYVVKKENNELIALLEENVEQEKECIIDCEKRTISIPECLKIAGVMEDNKTKRIYFRCNKKSQIADLSKKEPYIIYRNAKGEPDIYHCDDKKEDGEEVTFSWLISDYATRYKGNIQFLVYMKGEDTKKWHTTIAKLEVLEGMQVSEEIAEKNPDIIENILNEIFELNEKVNSMEEKDNEEIFKTVDIYLKEHPIKVDTDKSLTKEGIPADAKAVGEELKKEWRLINEITITEDAKKILLTQDSEGNDFEIEEFYIIGKFKSSGIFIFGINENIDGVYKGKQFNTKLGFSEDIETATEKVIIGSKFGDGFLVGTANQNGNNSIQSGDYSFITNPSKLNIKKVHGIHIESSSGNNAESMKGTTFKLYGR